MKLSYFIVFLYGWEPHLLVHNWLALAKSQSTPYLVDTKVYIGWNDIINIYIGVHTGDVTLMKTILYNLGRLINSNNRVTS